MPSDCGCQRSETELLRPVEEEPPCDECAAPPAKFDPTAPMNPSRAWSADELGNQQRRTYDAPRVHNGITRAPVRASPDTAAAIASDVVRYNGSKLDQKAREAAWPV